ncbi:AlkA N-terminal domain-containing protein [Amycolatopsis sp. NPDC059021]|uniref:AlkA N-terminal domain-containing protein n=1 Tax=Amycolatopsis sp. NPDC059021 TaxID=3346704 RepID=UPI00367303CE
MTTYSAVVTTGIYCRPGCGSKPLARNIRVFENAAAAEAAGFRACLHCRPYRVAGPIGSDTPELVCRAVRMIIDGALDHDGTEAALAERVGLSARHLRRLFLQHLGASPDQLARSRRAHFARRLLDDSDLTVLDVAFASGFGSLRQFNRAMREVFHASPTDLRNRRRKADRLVADGGLTLRLPILPGYDWSAIRAFLAARAVPGVESVEEETYRRTVTLDGAPGLLEILPGTADHLLLRAHLPYWYGLIHVVDRVGQLLGLDTDQATAATELRGDPRLGLLVRLRPGLAVPGTWSPFEVAVRAVLSRGREAGEATSWLGRIVRELGTPVPGLPGELTHTFPDPATVDAARLTGLGLPAGAASAIAAVATAVCGEDTPLRHGARASELAEVPGLDPELAQLIAYRLGDRTAFPAADPALKAALTELGVTRDLGGQPWSALAATHLIRHGDTLRPPSQGVHNGQLA